jgi:hypothetical protein
MDEKMLNETANEIQSFFKEMDVNIAMREYIYGKFKKLVPGDWQGFVNLGKEAGYNFTIAELKGILGEEFYTGRRAAWKDAPETPTAIGSSAIIGNWVIKDHPERKVVFTPEEVKVFENDIEDTSNKRKYVMGVEITLEYTFKFLNHEENTVVREKIRKFEDDEMTIINDDRTSKVKRWSDDTLIMNPAKNSIIGSWVDMDAVDDSIKLVFTENTLTYAVEAQHITPNMNFPNVPLSYKILAVEKILALTGENDTTYAKVLHVDDKEMTLEVDGQEIKFTRGKE